jgi:hypothetical protein
MAKVKTPEQAKRAQKYRCKLRYEMAIVKLKVRMRLARKKREWERLAAMGDITAQQELIDWAEEHWKPMPVFPA